MMWQLLQNELWLVTSTIPMFPIRNTGGKAMSVQRRQRLAQHHRKKRRIMTSRALATLHQQLEGPAETRGRIRLLGPLLVDQPEQVVRPRELGIARENPAHVVLNLRQSFPPALDRRRVKPQHGIGRPRRQLQGPL